jgi:hypothetical protein
VSRPWEEEKPPATVELRATLSLRKLNVFRRKKGVSHAASTYPKAKTTCRFRPKSQVTNQRQSHSDPPPLMQQVANASEMRVQSWFPTVRPCKHGDTV